MPIISKSTCYASTYEEHTSDVEPDCPLRREPRFSPERHVLRRPGGYGGWVGQTYRESSGGLVSVAATASNVRAVTAGGESYCVSEDGCLVYGQIT